MLDDVDVHFYFLKPRFSRATCSCQTHKRSFLSFNQSLLYFALDHLTVMLPQKSVQNQIHEVAYLRAQTLPTKSLP